MSEELIALIPTGTRLEDVGRVLKALSRVYIDAVVRDVEHSGTYLPRNGGLPRGCMEVFIPGDSEEDPALGERSGIVPERFRSTSRPRIGAGSGS